MNTILRRIMGTGNRIYQVSRFQQPSIISSGCVTSPLNTFRLLSNDSVDDIPPRKMLTRKITENPSKRWVLGTNLETVEEERARTVRIVGQLTEEIESGSELPAMEVINKVLSIFGYSPDIEGWDQQSIQRGQEAGTRIIYVKLLNVVDAQMLMNSELHLLKDYGMLSIQSGRKSDRVKTEVIQRLKQKIAEDPTKRWFVKNHYVTNIEFEEEVQARTVVVEGLLTEEIESGSELPGLEVINKVFSILGHSPKIDFWDQNSIKRGPKTGTRLIYVKLIRVYDAVRLVNDQVFLEGCGSLSLKINRPASLEELKKKMIENPSMYYRASNGKVMLLKPDSVTAE